MTEYICKEVQTDNGGYLEPVTELIRCKDCVYYRQYAVGRYDCDNLYGMADAHEDGFCSRAERKEE